jgi:5-methylcytosine-specific restriction enzyme subunit McrC
VYYNDVSISEADISVIPPPICFNEQPHKVCFKINEDRSIETNYFVGVDWVENTNRTIYVQPKLNNKTNAQTDYLKMLFSALRHPEIANHTDGLFEIKWGAKQIEIEQSQDLLTPLLVVQYLKLVHRIVQKGLKKSYYKVEQNLFGKVKGKIIVSKTIKHNTIKNKHLNTICNFEEFGINGLENRLLKKALTFVSKYLPSIPNINTSEYIKNTYNFINPAFEFVSTNVTIEEVKHIKSNPFYKEYKEAIVLAKLILKRFGYNLNNIQPNQKVKTPPFWIDMSKLFELYVLGILKDEFGGKVTYHFKDYGNELDYLLNTDEHKMVIDAKYKPRYSRNYLDSEQHNDIRQLSGYARLNSVYSHLKLADSKNIPCLIIFPLEINSSNSIDSAKFNEVLNFYNVADFTSLLSHKDVLINSYADFYKVAVRLPVLKFVE